MKFTPIHRVVVLVFIAAFAVVAQAGAQSPVALPSTMTTIAGQLPQTTVAGSACPTAPALTATDAYGDGCPAANATFGAAGRGGVAVDAFGNVIIGDDTLNAVGAIRMINPTTGILTRLAGLGTVCSGKLDAAGDGCIAATQTLTKQQRGIGIDPYGNVILAGYGDNLLHVICRVASPLCTSAQIGTMQLVAGCSTGTGSNGTGGAGSDNVLAKTTSATTCTAAKGEVYAPRGATADQYGNVYFADTSSYRWRVVLGPQTSSYFTGTNPLWAALGVYYSSLTAGYAYSVANISGTSGVATIKGASCSVTTNSLMYTGTALDTYGDGCPFSFSSANTGSSSYVTGVAVDAAGNMIFTDPAHGLRVLFVSSSGTAGAAMAAAISTNNGGVTPQAGFIYMLAGGSSGTTSVSATPALGNNVAALDTNIVKLTVSPQGDIYIGDGSKVLFFDINTGYIRTLLTSGTNATAGNYCSGSAGQTSLSAYSDGCPAAQSLFGNGSGLGVAVDTQGNLYLYDSANSGMLVRKVLAQGLAGQTVGTPLTQTIKVHLPESAAGTVTGATATLTSTTDITAGTPTCAQNADYSVDCSVVVTATPTAPGLRSAALTITLPAGTWLNPSATVRLGASVTGSLLVLDNLSATANSTVTAISPTTNHFGSNIAAAAIAVDGAGNVYGIDTNKGIVESVQGASEITLTTTVPTNPAQIAVDTLGNLFAIGSGTATIEELVVTGAPVSAGGTATFTTAQLSYVPLSGTATPTAVAVDSAGNVFVADKQSSTSNTAIFRLAVSDGTVLSQSTVATGYTNPVSLAVDGSGNVYVADKGVPAVYKLTPSATGSYTQTTLSSTVTPAAVATDAAGDVYVQDLTTGTVIEIPVSGPAVTVLSGLTTPTGLAVDNRGNVYSADAGVTYVTQVVRNALSYDFGTDESTVLSGTLTNAGTLAATGSNPATNTTNFSVLGGSTNGCSFTSSVMGAVTSGQACTWTAALVGSGSGTVTDVLSFLPSASTTGSLTLTGTLQGVAVGTTTTVTGQTPTSPVYVAGGGTEASFTVTVTPTSGATAPGGVVTVTVDSTVTTPTLIANGASGAATVTIAGLSAGTHTISAVYATNGTFTGSSSSTVSFTIAPITTSVSWAPGAATQQVSQAIGTGVLNAAATPSIAGTYSYTATPSGGAAQGIDAASYLGIGNYSLAVTFTPNDLVNYTTSTATASSYAVTKADTTATAGATTNLVAADGTGNYTSLSDALAALPTTGGSIYIAPGTYTGQNAVSYPNVQLRGLGGDAAKVILTAEDGAFSSPFVYPGSSAGNASASGDQGSSTLDVAKSAYIGTQATTGSVKYTPNNFFAEYLTIQNTYNTSTTSTTSYSTASGSCADTGVSHSLQYLYNAGTQCNSQALALWITSDQAVLNNVNLTSQQDTLYAGSQGCTSSTCVAARQYMWKGLITGNVDYVFGDAALVFDQTNFFTTWHGTSATGTETIEAQNKKFETGSTGDYLSGYVCNGCTLMSQSTGMTKLYYGRPYGAYSTWIMLNSNVDQVSDVGWIEFSSNTNLPTSTYAEYNTQPYTDPTVGTAPYPASLFGGSVVPTGGNTGSGVTGTRETTSTNPGTLEESNSVHTQLTAAQAAQYFPVTFLSNTVPAQSYTGFTSNWNPVTALATAVNSFASTGNITLASAGTSVTILGRPQTPGAGLIPTGSYQFIDGTTVIASGNLDAAGEAYLTTSTLTTGAHSITMVYSGDANFNASTSAAVVITVPAAPLTATTSVLAVTNSSSVYGGTIAGTVTVTPKTGTGTPTGTVTLLAGTTTAGSCTLSSGTCSYSLTGVGAGVQALTASYAGDTGFASSTSSAATVNVARAVLQVTAANATILVGAALPTYTYTITGFVNSDTQAAAVTGSPTLSSTATNSNTVGIYPINVATGTLAAANYSFAFSSGNLYIQQTSQAAAVATGDARTVTEPVFPAVCQVLAATLTSVNDDLPTTVDATVTNPDGARIQAALNSCSGTGLAVELSADSAGNNAFLSGPLVMPSGVTLLVDPGVTVFFSRNVQDYDKVAGTHTCGTINSNSATSSCSPLINIPGTSSNVGIMGYGKLDGRGGDVLLNAIDPYAGYTWWQLSSAANGVGNQQNPRFLQVNSGASNVTLYKITMKNSPLFHVAISGPVTGFTAWGMKIVTPSSSRNTDGIDPGNTTNATITRSWISDGDDNVAVGASGTGSQNISVTNNHFFAGHGESIGSYTSGGAVNILYDGNRLAGNGYANVGSSVGGLADSNSTAIRIKSANDRGGWIRNIQYSNSCFLDHKSDIEFTPLYNTNTGTSTPNYQNILLQNLVFVNDAATASTGTLQFTGAVNGTTINPLTVTLDNVTFPSVLSSSNFVTTGTEGTETNAQLTLGPGQVSANFVTAWTGFAGSNGNTLTDNRTATSLLPPQCRFTYIAPELTGPNGLPQTITLGQTATAYAILTPAVGGAAYPTGSVTLTDAFDNSTKTVALTGSSDTLAIPLSGLAVGTHTFTLTYSGDTTYVVPSGSSYYTQAGPYVVTVNSGSLAGTTTVLSGVPSSLTYGTSLTAVAAVTGSSPTGTVQFVVNGAVYATSAVSSGSANATLTLPYSTSAYSVTAIYSGDNANASSTSIASSVTVASAVTTTALGASSTTGALGHPVSITASVTSVAGTATGNVIFSYTTATNSTATIIETAPLVSGVATATASLPMGVSSVTAAYQGSGAYAASTSTVLSITVTAPTIVQLPTAPIALPYTISTIAGGGLTPGSSTMACTGATDKWGNGCLATAVGFTSGDDLRAVAADPFGNVYYTDISAALIRRIAPNGVIYNFAGRVSGTACVPTSSTGCTPTLVSISKPRGISSDASGNIFIADYSGDKVYKVSVTDNLMYLIAGTGTAASNGDGGAATSAAVYAPRAVWGDSVGNIYIADTTGNKIRVVDANGIIHTFAGTGTASATGDGGLATSATINNPQGVLTDANLNVYIADSRLRVVCVTCGTNSPLDALLAKLGITSPVNGYIYTLAGGASAAYSGSYPTLGTNVTMSPQKLAMDTSSNIYISDGNGVIWFFDVRTGSIRPIAIKASSVCTAASNTIGDGCPATQAIFGNNGNGIGVGTDTLGNIYISDTLNGRIRKVSTNLQSSSVATGASLSAPVQLHLIAGDSLAPTSGIAVGSSEWAAGTPSCTTNSDTTQDCLLTSTFTPAIPGARSTSLIVNSSLGNTAYLGLTGMALGAGATLDPATISTFGSGLSVAGLASDAAGNIYVADNASKSVLRYAAASIAQGTAAIPTTLATLTAPSAVAVDPRGYVYATDSSTGQLTEISPAGTIYTYTSNLGTPTGVAVDSLNKLYVVDRAGKLVYQIDPVTRVSRRFSISGMASPSGVSIDPSGNLLIADPGAPAVYRYSLQSGALTTISTTATAPATVVSDAAGNLLIADAAAILAVPTSANSAAFTVDSSTPSGLAIDGAGNLYTGNSSGAIRKLTRSQGYVQYANASAAAQKVNLLSTGNQALQLTSIARTDTSDYSLIATTSTDCALSSSFAGTLVTGGACSFTASYTPTTNVVTTDIATFNGNAANALLQLTLTGPATAPVSSISLNGFTPSTLVYGQTGTVSATVSGASITPAGTLVFTVDGVTQISATLASGVAQATLPVLSAGAHTISAVYTSSNSYANSSMASTPFTVAQATPTITWVAPAAITYNATLTTTQLNASSGGVAGTFVYTPSLGTVLHAGIQTLSVTFTPSDTVNYAQAKATVLLTVNQATPTITWTAPAAITYGAALTATQLNASSGGVAGTFVYTPSLGTVLGVGTQTLSVTFTPSDTVDYSTAGATTTIKVNQATTTIQLVSSANPVMQANSVTFTATLSSAGGTPTGAVSFYDGTTLLGSSALNAGGLATLSTSSLTAGTHSITAVYSASTGFAGVTSAAISEVVVDFTVTSPVSGGGSDGGSATAVPGGNAVFTLYFGSSTGSFAAPITFTATGLPTGATATFSPNPLTAPGNVQLTIKLPSTTTASLQKSPGWGRDGLPLVIGILLLPFARKGRRVSKRLSGMLMLTLLALGTLGAVIGLSGCGGASSGFFGPSAKTYNITVTATSGSLSHTTTVTLTVE